MEAPKFLKRIVFCVFAKRFVAGETIDDAIEKAKALEKKGIYAVINILGEHLKDGKEVSRICNQYLQLIEKLAARGLNHTHISVKPSQLGLEISEFLYQVNLSQILVAASTYLPEALVEIDRENHGQAQFVKELSLDFAQFFFNQRLACQINLDQTIEEIDELIEAGVSIRLCKGTAYSGDIKNEKEIRNRYLKEALLLDQKGNRPAIATHDLYLIDQLKHRNNLTYQVLLGIENKKMEKLTQQGKEVGFYIPCGPDWWAYGKRRGKVIPRLWLRNWWYRQKNN